MPVRWYVGFPPFFAGVAFFQFKILEAMSYSAPEALKTISITMLVIGVLGVVGLERRLLSVTALYVVCVGLLWLIASLFTILSFLLLLPAFGLLVWVGGKRIRYLSYERSSRTMPICVVCAAFGFSLAGTTSLLLVSIAMDHVQTEGLVSQEYASFLAWLPGGVAFVLYVLSVLSALAARTSAKERRIGRRSR